MSNKGQADTEGQVAASLFTGLNETLMERFRRYYGQYRLNSGTDEGFTLAKEALVFAMLNDISNYVEADDLLSIRRMMGEWDVILFMIQASNDSLKEYFEQ
ncbi:hypothetical protein SAMN02799624_06158 [Paenibacillus sp. UNC496MF]|uniref:hypothetical protein n=1 Tax=Paenibacillus sp. UNC496MF TaxID=1502753 RepID=UPI0008E934E1|nr:hypothetical protein [Paenibacillus sp. UNC496MF]SFJ82874.1 hypothetical protein SAMN02799624_06158 [Paenibacillus sp. UNC496MF]